MVTQVASGPVRIPRRRPLSACAGLVAVGHHVYWSQFDGLLAELDRKRRVVKAQIESHGVSVGRLRDDR